MCKVNLFSSTVHVGMAKPSACDWNFHEDKIESRLLTAAKSNFPQHPVAGRAATGKGQVIHGNVNAEQ